MSDTVIAALIGSIIAVVGSLAAAIRVASSAWRDSVDKAALHLEHKRLADQAQATVKAKDEEIAELKAENERLWALLPGQDA